MSEIRLNYFKIRKTTTGYNTGLAKVAVQCFADTLVVNQSLVLRINICGENRQLLKPANRYTQCYGDSASSKLTA